MQFNSRRQHTSRCVVLGRDSRRARVVAIDRGHVADRVQQAGGQLLHFSRGYSLAPGAFEVIFVCDLHNAGYIARDRTAVLPAGCNISAPGNTYVRRATVTFEGFRIPERKAGCLFGGNQVDFHKLVCVPGEGKREQNQRNEKRFEQPHCGPP